MTCEDRGWQSQRELHAEELSLDRRNHVRPQRGLSPTAQQRKEEAQAVREYYAYQERVKQYHREQGWNSTPYKDVPPGLRGTEPARQCGGDVGQAGDDE